MKKSIEEYIDEQARRPYNSEQHKLPWDCMEMIIASQQPDSSTHNFLDKQEEH